MILEELKQILEETGYPVSYSHFSKPPVAPFIAYLVNNSSNLFADDKVFVKIDNAQIELYTEKKDLTVETKLEKLLDDNSIPYETEESFIKEQQLYQKVYEVSL